MVAGLKANRVPHEFTMKLALFALTFALVAPTFAETQPQQARVLFRSKAAIVAVAYAPDGKTLASADDAYNVRLTDVSSGQTRQAFAYKERVASLAFAPDGKLLAIGVGKQIRLLNPKTDMKTAAPVRVLETSIMVYKPLQFSANGRVLLAVEGGYKRDSQDNSLDYGVEVWDVASGRKISNYTAKDTDTYAASLSPDGKTFVALNRRFSRSLFSVATGKEIRELSNAFTHDTPPFEVPFVSTLTFSPDGKWIAGTGSYFEANGHLTLWETASGKIKWSRNFYDYGSAIAWAPDSSRVAAGTSYDTTYDDPNNLHRPTGAPIWNANGKWQRSVQRVPGEISALAWSPDGKTLATGAADGAVRLWKVG